MTAEAAFRLEPGEVPGTLSAQIALDHGFYFDHPLHHLPGLLLLDVALAALARRRPPGARPWFSRIEAAFHSLAALTVPLEITLSDEDASGLARCTLAQAGKMRAEIVAELRAAAEGQAPGREGDAAPPAAFAPLARTAVRKLKADNVFLGQRDDGLLRAVRPPQDAARGCALETCRDGLYSPVYLTECFLQLCRAGRCESFGPAHGIPISREVLVQIGARLPRPVPADARLEIGFWPKPEMGRFPRHPRARRRTARLFSGAETVARLFCDVLPLSRP